MKAYRLALLLLACLAAPAAGQAPAHAGVVLSLFGGGGAFSGFQAVRVASNAPATDPSAAAGEFGGNLSAQAGAAFGAAATYWLGPQWGVRVVASYVPSVLEIRMDEEDLERLDPDAENGGLAEFNELSVVGLEVSAVIDLPVGVGVVAPYAAAGGALLSYDLSAAAAPAPSMSGGLEPGRRLRPAAALALGAVVPLTTPEFSLFFELSTALGPTPVTEEGPEHTLSTESVTARLLSRDAGENADGPQRIGLTSTVRFVAGFTFGLGRRRAQRRSASAGGAAGRSTRSSVRLRSDQDSARTRSSTA